MGVIEAKAAARKWRHWVAEARSKRDESESRQLDHWCVQSYVYRKADGASSGPICIGELQEMLADGTLTPDTVRSHTQTADRCYHPFLAVKVSTQRVGLSSEC